MITLKESGGYYAIAGFLYQFLGSGVAAFDICGGLKSDEEPTEVLLVERFGEDAVIFPVDGSGKKPRLVQYKYSIEAHSVAPSELREILEAFMTSVRKLGVTIDQAAFELVTNRPYSPVSQRWGAANAADGAGLEASHSAVLNQRTGGGTRACLDLSNSPPKGSHRGRPTRRDTEDRREFWDAGCRGQHRHRSTRWADNGKGWPPG